MMGLDTDQEPALQPTCTVRHHIVSPLHTWTVCLLSLTAGHPEMHALTILLVSTCMSSQKSHRKGDSHTLAQALIIGKLLCVGASHMVHCAATAHSGTLRRIWRLRHRPFSL